MRNYNYSQTHFYFNRRFLIIDNLIQFEIQIHMICFPSLLAQKYDFFKLLPFELEPN